MEVYVSDPFVQVKRIDAKGNSQTIQRAFNGAAVFASTLSITRHPPTGPLTAGIEFRLSENSAETPLEARLFLDVNNARELAVQILDMCDDLDAETPQSDPTP